MCGPSPRLHTLSGTPPSSDHQTLSQSSAAVQAEPVKLLDQHWSLEFSWAAMFFLSYSSRSPRSFPNVNEDPANLMTCANPLEVPAARSCRLWAVKSFADGFGLSFAAVSLQTAVQASNQQLVQLELWSRCSHMNCVHTLACYHGANYPTLSSGRRNDRRILKAIRTDEVLRFKRSDPVPDTFLCLILLFSVHMDVDQILWQICSHIHTSRTQVAVLPSPLLSFLCSFM